MQHFSKHVNVSCDMMGSDSARFNCSRIFSRRASTLSIGTGRACAYAVANAEKDFRSCETPTAVISLNHRSAPSAFPPSAFALIITLYETWSGCNPASFIRSSQCSALSTSRARAQALSTVLNGTAFGVNPAFSMASNHRSAP